MFAIGLFEAPAWLLSWFYGLTHSYGIAILLMAVLVMVITAPLTLKSTKGMLEMQRLAPEMRRLQQQHRNDRQKLNEEMMKLYQEHKVNPAASCLPLLAQMPIFIIMFRILHGLTYKPVGDAKPLAHAVLTAAGEGRREIGFVPRYIDHGSELFQSLTHLTEMRSFGLDLAKSPAAALGDGFGTGLVYALLVVALGALYFLQQRMVAARAAVSPTMSPAQQKLMQYLPVVFAVFQIFFLTGLVIYYMAQAVLRILLQAYITRRFYGHDESLGRQAQRAGEQARELAKSDGESGGIFAQARAAARGGGGDPDANGKSGKSAKAAKGDPESRPQPKPTTSKRTTAPKNRPTPTGKGPSGRPNRASSTNRPGGSRSKAADRKRR